MEGGVAGGRAGGVKMLQLRWWSQQSLRSEKDTIPATSKRTPTCNQGLPGPASLDSTAADKDDDNDNGKRVTSGRCRAARLLSCARFRAVRSKATITHALDGRHSLRNGGQGCNLHTLAYDFNHCD